MSDSFVSTPQAQKRVTAIGYTVIFGFLALIVVWGLSSHHYKATHMPSPEELARMTGSEP